MLTPPPRGVDSSTPNVARMYDYYLGGKDNFEADRVAAEKVLALVPGLRRAAPSCTSCPMTRTRPGS
jgi:hypothetical protein